MLDKEMNIDKKAVGKKIRQIRISRGYTLQGFGILLGAMFNIGKMDIVYLIKKD